MVQGATELTWEEVLKHCEKNQVRLNILNGKVKPPIVSIIVSIPRYSYKTILGNNRHLLNDFIVTNTFTLTLKARHQPNTQFSESHVCFVHKRTLKLSLLIHITLSFFST